MPFNILRRCRKIRKRGLALDEPQIHKTARRVVDIDKQRAFGAAVLKPIMLRTVNLDELAVTFPSWPWLMDSRLAVPGAQA
jgi:hypothetical protein